MSNRTTAPRRREVQTARLTRAQQQHIEQIRIDAHAIASRIGQIVEVDPPAALDQVLGRLVVNAAASLMKLADQLSSQMITAGVVESQQRPDAPAPERFAPGDMVVIDGPQLAQVIVHDAGALILAPLMDLATFEPLDPAKRIGWDAHDNVSRVPALPFRGCAIETQDAVGRDGTAFRIGDIITDITTDGRGGRIVAICSKCVMWRGGPTVYDFNSAENLELLLREE